MLDNVTLICYAKDMKATQPYNTDNPTPGRYHPGHRPMDSDDKSAVIVMLLAVIFGLLWYAASQ